MDLEAKFYLLLFAFPCVIILSTHYGKLSSITAVFSPQEHIRIDIRYLESLQGSKVSYPGLWILKSWDTGPRSQVLESWGP